MFKKDFGINLSLRQVHCGSRVLLCKAVKCSNIQPCHKITSPRLSESLCATLLYFQYLSFYLSHSITVLKTDTGFFNRVYVSSDIGLSVPYGYVCKIYITASPPKFPLRLPQLIFDMSFKFCQNVTITVLFCPQTELFHSANLCQA